MRVLVLILLSVLSLSTAVAQPQRFRLDPIHCQVLFFADHLGFSRQMGRFTGVRGEILIDPDDWSSARVEAEVDVGTLWLGDGAWERKMLSDDFFAAKRHPSMRFVSDRLETTGADTALLHGRLTLRGIERPVVLELTRNRIGRNSFNLKYTAGFSARGTVRRSEFGINRLPAAIADEVEIRLEIESIRD